MAHASRSLTTLALAGALTTFAAVAPHALAVDGDVPDDPEPTVAFSLLDAGSVVEGDSATKEVSWVVASALPATQDCTVEVVFEPGSSTADPGTDVGVDAVSGALISEGSTSAEVPGEVIGDEMIESDETVTVSLRSASISGFPGCPVVEGATSTLVIRDDDRPVLSVTGEDVVEGNSGTRTMPFSISAAAPVKDDCEVGVRVGVSEALSTAVAPTVGAADGVDVASAAFSTVVLTRGATSVDIDVIVRGDLDVEDDELVTVTAMAAPGDALPDCTLTDRSGSALILNDDEPIVEEPPATEPPTTAPSTTEPPVTTAVPTTTAAPTTEAPTTTGAPTTEAPTTVATTQPATTVPEVLAQGPVTTAPIPVVSGQLPTTGGDSSALTTLGALSILAGALTLLVARLRRGRRTA